MTDPTMSRSEREDEVPSRLATTSDPAERATWRRRPMRWVGVALVLAGVNLVWNWQGNVAPVDSAPRLVPRPLRISEVRSQVHSDGTSLVVEVRVRNAGTRRHQGRVWWQLAPATDGRTPWERRVYESRIAQVDLLPDAETTLRWLETAAVREGRYEVRAWAQLQRRTRATPSDGADSDPPSVILGGRHQLLRHRPVPADVVITGVVADAVEGGGFHAEVTIRNNGAAARLGWVRWVLDEGEPDPRYWWRSAGAWRGSLYEEFHVEGNEDVVVRLRQRRPIAAGRHALRMRLGFDDAAHAIDAGASEDEVLAVLDLGGPEPARPARRDP